MNTGDEFVEILVFVGQVDAVGEWGREQGKFWDFLENFWPNLSKLELFWAKFHQKSKICPVRSDDFCYFLGWIGAVFPSVPNFLKNAKKSINYLNPKFDSIIWYDVQITPKIQTKIRKKNPFLSVKSVWNPHFKYKQSIKITYLFLNSIRGYYFLNLHLYLDLNFGLVNEYNSKREKKLNSLILFCFKLMDLMIFQFFYIFFLILYLFEMKENEKKMKKNLKNQKIEKNLH